MANTRLQLLESFLAKELPDLKYATPSSPEYAEWRHIYIQSNKATPLMITRPQTAEDVAKLVKYIVDNGIEFTIRGGGHEYVLLPLFL
jgi:FAD/FMN-containing dehydrogenase